MVFVDTVTPPSNLVESCTPWWFVSSPALPWWLSGGLSSSVRHHHGRWCVCQFMSSSSSWLRWCVLLKRRWFGFFFIIVVRILLCFLHGGWGFVVGPYSQKWFSICSKLSQQTVGARICYRLVVELTPALKNLIICCSSNYANLFMQFGFASSVGGFNGLCSWCVVLFSFWLSFVVLYLLGCCYDFN
jgi:hypothetical protein